MPIEAFYDFHGILKVSIYRDKRVPFFDSYLEGVFAPYQVPASGPADLEIRIEPGKPDLKNCFWVDGRFAVRKNFIYYKNHFKSADWGVEITGLESSTTQVRLYSNLFARPVLAGETLYSLLRFKLAQKGYALVHSSGIDRDGKGFFFAARGGVGKTITAIHATKRGCKLLGDDTIILGPQGDMFGFAIPFNLRFTYDIEKLLEITFSPRLKAEINFKKFLAWITAGHYRLFTTVSPHQVFPNAIGKHVPLHGVFILISGSQFELKEIKDHKIFVQQLLKIIEFETPELKGLLSAYSYVYPKPALAHFWQDYEMLLQKALQGMPCYFVTMPPVYTLDYFETLWKEMQECQKSITTSTI